MTKSNVKKIFHNFIHAFPLLFLFILVFTGFDLSFFLFENNYSFNLIYILIFYWILKKPDRLGYGLIFLAGIINDVVQNFPIGISSINYLLLCAIAAFIKNRTLVPNLLFDWIFFLIAILLSLTAMLIYIWIRFEWQFSIGAIIALFHDVILTLGIFSLFNLEINLSIVAAVLTIVGYSMNDSVVIFDRVRENLKKYSDIKIFNLTNLSINETLSRTIITSATTLLALFSIYLFGGEILKGFSLAMILGVIFGTYSSIYIANPILVFLNVSQTTILKEDKD